MKSSIIYGLIFGMAFVVVTILIILMNSMYTNIFQFDFSPNNHARGGKNVIVQNSKAGAGVLDPKYQEKIRKEILDSMKSYKDQFAVYDSNYVSVVFDSTLGDSLARIRQKLNELEKRNKEILAKKEEIQQSDSLKSENDKKKFEEWAKETAKLYEVMDPRKAAKIIQNFPDNESREILFRMNKKKAAKILAELKPDLAQRITGHYDVN